VEGRGRAEKCRSKRKRGGVGKSLESGRPKALNVIGNISGRNGLQEEERVKAKLRNEPHGTARTVRGKQKSYKRKEEGAGKKLEKQKLPGAQGYTRLSRGSSKERKRNALQQGQGRGDVRKG